MVHVELASRMANAYGGGVPLEVDPLAVEPPVSPEADELLGACELAVRVSCVGESFSLPLIARELAGANDAVTRAVLQRIVADEAPHAMVGWLVLDWALPRLGPTGLQHLEEVAEDALDALAPALQKTHGDRAFYDHVLLTRVAAPLGKRGLRVRDTFGVSAQVA
jgi:hypothetical protein